MRLIMLPVCMQKNNIIKATVPYNFFFKFRFLSLPILYYEYTLAYWKNTFLGERVLTQSRKFCK